MRDKGLIIFGLLVFFLVVTIPFSYNLISKTNTGSAPEPEILPEMAGDKCVRSKDYMRPYHMDLLNEWRDSVVRKGERFTEGPHGEQIEKSLSLTCLKCHANKENFCDRCHNYMAVDPYCWDCHVSPAEAVPPQMAATQILQEDN